MQHRFQWNFINPQNVPKAKESDCLRTLPYYFELEYFCQQEYA
jgi:hypothetical protein